jgi:hypothetical protein
MQRLTAAVVSIVKGPFHITGKSPAPGAVLDEPRCDGPMHWPDHGPDNSGGGMVSVKQLGG